MTSELTARPHRVVIVGGGFAGLHAALRLGRARGPRLEIIVLDRRNHHLFQPLLYQVAMAGLSPADISMPIRSVLRRFRNIEVRLVDVVGVERDAKRLLTSHGPVDFDSLILACGASHSYFGKDHWESYAPGLKSIEDATEIRRRVLTAFEEAELEPDANRRSELLTFVVVGGGPTGAELAGALGEISRFTLSRDFRRVDPSRTRVILIEGGPRILPSFSETLSRAAARSLERLGVTIWTSKLVDDITPDGVRLHGGEFVRARTVLWAAGVRAAALSATLGAELDHAGRVRVERDLSLPGAPDIFVVGDQAAVLRADGKTPVPGQAPAAIQAGNAAAENILRDLRGEPRRPFHYVDKGSMATLGRAAAVAERGKLRCSGFLAWLMWCFVHIFFLIGFRNRLLVLIQWMWSYVRFKRGARLILGQAPHSADREAMARWPSPRSGARKD
ncbi:MAG: NAD(P)/FAD-dependent oxidoreductase [Planctomycetota bacterium]